MLEAELPGASLGSRQATWVWTGQQWAWAFYECARNPFYVLINIYVFSAYFVQFVVGDPVWGQALWGYTLSAAALIIACSAPILGAIADAGGRRKPWLLACIALAVPAIAALVTARPGMGGAAWPIVIALVLANVGYELSSIFYNALLPLVAPRHRLGSVSGLAYALANLSGVVLFGAYLLGVSWAGEGFPEIIAQHWPERVTPAVVAAWFALFSLPILLRVRDAAATDRPTGTVVREGLARLRTSVRRLRALPNLFAYQLARMVFNEGFIVLMMFMGVFSAGVLGWTAFQLSVLGISLSVVATLGSFAGGWLDDHLGSLRTLQVCIWGSITANLLLISITPSEVLFLAVDPTPHGGTYPRVADWAFCVTEAFAAFFVTAGLVSSRAMLAKLSPPEALNEMFSLYALSGTATSFLGPLTIAILTQLAGSQRVGLAAGLVFLGLGLLLLRRLRHTLPA